MSYNKSAERLASKFNNQGARVADIQEVFSLIKKENSAVLEIGCGNGRDAQEIIKYTNNYLGIDISPELIKLANEQVLTAQFEVADFETYEFSGNWDIVFAFASLIHADKNHLTAILSKLHQSLNAGGIVRLSMKYANTYREITKKDEFGIRTYYLYSLDDIKSTAKGFSVLKSELMELRGQQWLEVILKKS